MVNFMCQLHRITNAHKFWLNIILGCLWAWLQMKYAFKFYLFIYLAALSLSCSVWDLWYSFLLVKSFIATYGIQFSDQWWNLGALHRKHRVLATGPWFESIDSVSSLFSLIWRGFTQCVESELNKGAKRGRVQILLHDDLISNNYLLLPSHFCIQDFRLRLETLPLAPLALRSLDWITLPSPTWRQQTVGLFSLCNWMIQSLIINFIYI